MSDWLDEIENKQKRETADRLAEWERGRPAREAAAAAANASYARNRDVIEKAFDSITEYAKRANVLTDVVLAWKRDSREFLLEKRKDRYSTLVLKSIKIYVSKDDFTLATDYPIPYPGPHRYHGRGDTWLVIPIHRVTKEHISSWVKWLAQEDGPPHWKDVTPYKRHPLPNHDSFFYPWLPIVIVVIVVLLIWWFSS